MLHPSQISRNSVLIAQTRFMEDTDYSVEIEVSEASTGFITICVSQISTENDDPVVVKFFGPKQEEVAATVSLLGEAYERLMVSEGDARYIARNVDLAERIAATLNGPDKDANREVAAMREP